MKVTISTDITDKEKLEHLLNGGELVKKASKDRVFLSEGNLVSGDGSSIISLTLSFYDILKQEPEWYENIPEDGTFCLVWNSEMSPLTARFIQHYEKNHKFPFRAREDSCVLLYKYAHPVPEDISLQDALALRNQLKKDHVSS